MQTTHPTVLVALIEQPESFKITSWVKQNVPLNSKLILMSIRETTDIDSPNTFTIGASHNWKDWGDAIPLKKAQDFLSNHQLDLENSGFKNIVSFALRGFSVCQEICARADDFNVDLLVIGKRNLSFIDRVVKTSISDYCLHNANCCVAVVKF